MNRASNLVAACALSLVVVLPRAAFAQLGDQMPEPAYYAAVNELYSGQYRDAERAFRRLARTGVQAAQTRWIDSICYHAMLGEVLYHQGRNAEALASFDQACLLLLSYPDFLKRVTFDDPRPDANATRQPVPWGGGGRPMAIGALPRTMRVLIGDFGAAQQAVEQGGVFMQPQYWRVNVAEIVRTSALAMRRRNQMLGPLGKHDRISKELAATMVRRNLTHPNHWSSAWTELLAGIAKEGVGANDEARTHLGRAVLLGGQFDHPLTGVALLEQGHLAIAAGDHRAAGQLLVDASASAFYHDDADVIAESLSLGWQNFLAGGQSGMYAPLEPASAWAGANRLWHVATTLRLALAENLVRAGKVADAGTVVEEVGRRLGQMRDSRLGIEQMFLQAVVQSARRQFEPAMVALDRAVAGQRQASLKNFQIVRASELFDAGDLSSRVAPDVFGHLLSDPSAAAWTTQTFDTLAVLATPHGPAFDRWFFAALSRKDAAAALEVAERAKRARFLATLPLGGRMLALRSVLETPIAELPKAAALERQQLLASFPAYRELSTAAARLYQQIRSNPLDLDSGGPALAAQLSQWSENASAREELLLPMALSPVPSTIVFPPLRTTEELKQSLPEGQALVVFHEAGGNLFGFLVSNQTEHVWELGEAQAVQRVLSDWLRELGNYSASREMAGAELASGQWRESAAKIYHALFVDSRLDLSKTTDLAIVPDSWLWYLPFEALVPPVDAAEDDAPATLIERVALHYGPTAALAVGDIRAFRPTLHTGIVAKGLSGADAKTGDEVTSFALLEDVVQGPTRLAPPLSQPGFVLAPLLDQLIVMDDVEVNRNDAYAWSPFPRARGRNADSIAAWMGLPYEGPERIVLSGFPTAAETGLKGSRRGSDVVSPGSEMFQSVCALLASGARTVLISRWRTGGQMNSQLVREFVQELQTDTATSADVAWQRSIFLARETPLDAAQEPRLKRLKEDAESPGADHPFFWAGYMLVDTGTLPNRLAGGREDPLDVVPAAGDPPRNAPKPGLPPQSGATPDQPAGPASDRFPSVESTEK